VVAENAPALRRGQDSRTVWGNRPMRTEHGSTGHQIRVRLHVRAQPWAPGRAPLVEVDPDRVIGGGMRECDDPEHSLNAVANRRAVDRPGDKHDAPGCPAGRDHDLDDRPGWKLAVL